jgi:hypothetical protein
LNKNGNVEQEERTKLLAKIWNFSQMNGFEFFLEASAEYVLSQQNYIELPCAGIVRSYISRGSIRTAADRYAALISHPNRDYLVLFRNFGDYEVFMRSWSCLAPVADSFLG